MLSRGLSPRESSLILKFAISFHTFADDGKAVSPEFPGADVDAKAVGEFSRAVLACGGKQVLVIRHKVSAAFLVDGIQACCEEQAKGVGEIIEG
jgi:hypothetical protein